MRIFSVLILSAGLLFAKELPVDTKQILLVSSREWSAPSGTLQRYEKIKNRWRKVGEPMSVELGRRGMAWGRGLHETPKSATNIKREGDKRAPAGVFRLPFAFGASSLKVAYPYKKMSSRNRCVDDSNSKYYNQIIDSTKVPKDYNSFEKMKLSSGLYDYGLFVAHNRDQVRYGGSCIFLHIKRGVQRPTVGCTAMSREQMVKIIKWLDIHKNPLLIQAPKSELDRLFNP